GLAPARWHPPMGLRESPYPNGCLAGLDSALRALLFPTYWLLSQMLALRRTTAEKAAQRGPAYALQVLGRGPALLLLLLLSAPLALLAFLAWLPLQTARRPFAYQHTPGRGPPDAWELPGRGRALTFVTCNVCLLPEGLARFSNLAHTQRRAKRIGQLLAEASCLPLPRGDADVAIEMPPEEGEAVAQGPGEITAQFPPGADFLCLQEVFDLRASAHLRQLLAPRYEHLVHDVGVYGLVGCSTLKLFNSGLLLASRYPLLAVRYHCYAASAGEDAFSAKGLLCAQVSLSGRQRIVGYLNCTHMHAPDADAQIRCEQLTFSLRCAQQFQEAHGLPGDVVAFDVYCGDLNFDNCSSGNEREQGHEIFRWYTDPCREGPRKDKAWAIGEHPGPPSPQDAPWLRGPRRAVRRHGVGRGRGVGQAPLLPPAPITTLRGSPRALQAPCWTTWRSTAKPWRPQRACAGEACPRAWQPGGTWGAG
uniref:sphingomyelin phosphodiesterase n=1 Tax=Varanus komodoensis TaxID=61221 RepID=A0A8D2IWQ0_VARKO